MLRYAPNSRSARPMCRNLRLECLENRFMLSHPAVADVNISSTEWDASFISFLESESLGTGGYSIPVGSSDQLQTISWNNVDQIRITFSEDVVIEAADLSVSGVNTTAYVFSDFSYDSNTYTAVWTLDSAITKDKIVLDLDADGLDPVRSVSTAEVLDGAWTDCQSTYNSGDGQGGDDFQFRINVLPGDTDASAGVNLGDAVVVYYQIGKSAGESGYNIRYDIDGSGEIAIDDYFAVRYKFGGSLPSGDPVGMSNDAPTTYGFDDLSFATDAEDYILALTDFFDDAETQAANLVYSIVGNTNPSLFDSLDIDSGELTIDFDNEATGDAVITIRATDGAGLIVETTLEVHISDPPVISNFYCIAEYGDFWTLSGIITDNDDDVEGFLVTFGGVLESFGITATAREDGVFCVTVELVGLQEGTATAQTEDPHEVLSNLAQYWMFVD